MTSARPGVLVPLVTPLTDAGEVCDQSVGALVDHVRPFVAALVPALTSGEGWRLTASQWEAMVRCTLEYAEGLPVYAGVELSSTAEVVDRARLAIVLGVDAVVVTTPFGPAVDQRSMYDHIAAVVDQTGAHVIFYNESAVSANNTALATLKRICDLGGVIGVKESSGDPGVTRALLSHGADVCIYQGWEHLLLDPADVAGYAVALANLEPRLCADVLATRSPDALRAVVEACNRYGLFDDDWYCGVKKELVARGVIKTEQLVGTEA